MDLKAVEKVVSALQHNLFRNARNQSAGIMKSHFKGSGLIFKEHQVYVPGDDIRNIDWKLLAKTGHPFIKKFEEERNIEIFIFLDCSQSMFMGYESVSKLRAGIEICCLLYFLAEKTKDFIHTMVLSDHFVNIPAAKGKDGIVRLVSQLIEQDILTSKGNVNYKFRAKKKVNHDENYRNILKYISNKKEVVILSDFYDFLDPKNFQFFLTKKNFHFFNAFVSV